MSESRKAKGRKSRRATVDGARDDQGFQDRLMGMLEWLADKDPVKAARLLREYMDDLADELGPASPKPAKG
jgi:hypothetical protein